MQGLASIWRALPATKRAMLVGAVAATIIAFSLLARTASTPSMALLYSGLEPSAAGEVIAALEAMNVETDVRGDSIYVPENRRDFVRLTLAREGLPQQGQAGYELLERLNGFSTTSEIFNVTYWRAVEGELARTIIATPGVKAARVHIANLRESRFSRNGPEPKAVVTVSVGRGSLSPSQAQSIRFLVSSSVPGLSSDQVAVLDSERGVILSPGQLDENAANQSAAGGREQQMEADVLNLLEARVGAGNARVQIALEIDNEREAISERVFDPQGRVLAGKETTEVTEKSNGSEPNNVSVDSNLPDDEANASMSSTERTQTDETVQYQISEIQREREKAPGAVKRLSVAVLVNDSLEDGEGFSEEEMASLRELVAMAVGFDEARGDTLTVQSMPFKPIESAGVTVEENAVMDFLGRHAMMMIQIGVLSIVTLVLGLFVVKPVLSSASKGAASPAPATATIAPAAAAAAVDGAPAAAVAQSTDSVEVLRNLASDKSDETTMLIKSWLEEENAA